MPLNAAYSPILGDRAAIVGKVVAVLRRVLTGAGPNRRWLIAAAPPGSHDAQAGRPTPLPDPGQRELIAAYVSGRNDCRFCTLWHSGWIWSIRSAPIRVRRRSPSS